MTTRKAPRAFRLTEGEPTSETINQPTAEAADPGSLPAITDELRRAVAEYIRSAREHAEVRAIAERHGELIARTDEDVLNLEAINQLLDPMAGKEQRWQLFRTLIGVGAQHQRINGLNGRVVSDEQWLCRLFDETCGWGSQVDQLLDDVTISDISIVGTRIYANGREGRVVLERGYAHADEPLRRAEFLALATGKAWNRSSPELSILPRVGTRLIAMREPHVRPDQPDQPGFLLFIRRRRREAATLAGLVEQGILDRQGAALLALLLHAGCSFLIGGTRQTGKSTLLEALANAMAFDRHLYLVEDDWHGLQLAEEHVKTSLNITLGQRFGEWHQHMTLCRALMSQRGDTLVLDPGTLLLPDVGLQQAASGMPTLLTVEGERVAQVIERLAIQAAWSLHSPFRNDAGAARRAIGTGFHVVLQVGYTHRLQRHYLSEVMLIAGTDGADQVVTMPLIEAHVGDAEIAWVCHAQLGAGSLTWVTAGRQTPSSIAAKLADLPEQLWAHLAEAPLARPPLQCTDLDSLVYERQLRRIRAVLQAGEADEIIALVNAVVQREGEARGARLIDEALAQPRIRTRVEERLEAAAAVIRAALEAWDLSQAETLVDQAQEDALVSRLPDWQVLVAEVQTRCTAVAACQAALQEASGHRQRGDLAAALVVLRPIAGDALPPELRRTLLAARRALLTQIIAQTQDDLEVQQQYVSELEQVNRALTPGSSAPEEHTGVKKQRASGSARAISASPSTAASAPEDHAASLPATNRMGWLDAALAHNRERARLRQTTQEAE